LKRIIRANLVLHQNWSPEVKTWGQLKQWLQRNPISTLPTSRIEDVQTAQFGRIIRIKQQQQFAQQTRSLPPCDRCRRLQLDCHRSSSHSRSCAGCDNEKTLCTRTTNKYEIKCICGTTEDDGDTTLCSNCHTQQHINCYYATQSKPDVHRCIDCGPQVATSGQGTPYYHKQKLTEDDFKLNLLFQRNATVRSSDSDEDRRAMHNRHGSALSDTAHSDLFVPPTIQSTLRNRS
jgi:hypothetical protein